MQKLCEICGSIADNRLTPDLDIMGIAACEEHLAILIEAYYILIYLGEEDYQAYLEKFKPPTKNK